MSLYRNVRLQKCRLTENPMSNCPLPNWPLTEASQCNWNGKLRLLRYIKIVWNKTILSNNWFAFSFRHLRPCISFPAHTSFPISLQLLGYATASFSGIHNYCYVYLSYKFMTNIGTSWLFQAEPPKCICVGMIHTRMEYLIKLKC